jgi:DNA-directed RNA polymerase beta' subunit
MIPEKEWYCFVCRKMVDVNAVGISVIGVTAQQTCKECGLPFVIELKKTSPEEFEKLAKKFKEETDKL